MDVLVILPTFNEAENIGNVLPRIRAALPRATVLVVDDGSPDGTAELAESVGRQLGGIIVLRRDEKSGLGSAYRAGFRWGLLQGFDVCVEMDADLSHRPEALPELVSPLADGFELAIGSRYIPGASIPNWSWHRRMLSKAGNVYASGLLGLHVSDSTAGFRAYGASVLERIDLDAIRAEGYGFQIEMTYAARRAGAAIAEVPIQFVDRVEGESKMSTAIVVEALALVTTWGVRRLFGLGGVTSRTGTEPGMSDRTGVGSHAGGSRTVPSGLA
jgi:glycosyltransferase involved in cell wall biosynthesis